LVSPLVVCLPSTCASIAPSPVFLCWIFPRNSRAARRTRPPVVGWFRTRSDHRLPSSRPPPAVGPPTSFVLVSVVLKFLPMGLVEIFLFLVES